MNMSKKIITHPANLEFVKRLFKAKDNTERIRDNGFIHFINPFSANVKFVTNEHMEKDRWTGKWEILQDRFTTWWDGKGEPPSWCIYFGFVRKQMEPLFYEIDDTVTCMNLSWGWGIKDTNRSFVTLAQGV